MTSAQEAGESHVRGAGPRVLQAGSRSLSAAADALLDGGPSGRVRARHRRLRELLRDADGRPRDGVRQRLRLPDPAARAGGGDPAALPARGRGDGGQALARAAPGVGRDVQAERDREAPRAAGGRSRRALRRRAGRVPRPLPRPPRGDDQPAHALHGERGRADGRLPRPRRRLDGPAAGRAARPHARRLARVGGSVGRAGGSDRRDSGGRGCAGAPGVGRRPGRGRSRRCARSTARRARP